MLSRPSSGQKRRFDERIAVIDLGSNTARLAVFELHKGELRTVAGDRVALKLMRAIDADGNLSAQAQVRVRDTLQRFKAVADGAGADRIVAVATSAIRDAGNGPAFLAALRAKTGINVTIIDGMTEARHSFWGAIYNLDFKDGVVIDIGGGSLEIARFRDRQLVEVKMVELGALRLSDAFLASDPPDPREMRDLVNHVRAQLAKLHLPELASGEVLVGTGGTIRNLASVNRDGEAPDDADPTQMTATEVARMVGQLSKVSGEDRADIPGLSSDRTDSIIGGAIALQLVMQALAARRITVSSGGLREGVALSVIARQIAGKTLSAGDDIAGVA